MAKFIKVSLHSSLEFDPEDKKAYIDKMYSNKYDCKSESEFKQGLPLKFNNAIGFKPIVDIIDYYNNLTKAIVNSNKDYISPEQLIYESMTTPYYGKDILIFYFQITTIKNAIDDKYTYKTRDIALKWGNFLKKFFSRDKYLNVGVEVIDEVPKQSIKEFALEYFFRNISRNINFTLEFSSEKLLTKEEGIDILDKLRELTDEDICIAQYKCDSCIYNTNNKRPYHIEILYLDKINSILDYKDILLAI